MRHSHDRCDQMIGVLTQTNTLLREEIVILRRERELAVNQLLLLAGRPDAVAVVDDSSVADAPDEPPKTAEEAEQEAIEQEQHLIDKINEQAEKELRTYADGRAMPVEALYDA